MREIYRGNGFVVLTNDSGEIFVSLESRASAIRISAVPHNSEMLVSYANTTFEMTPVGMKTISFRPN